MSDLPECLQPAVDQLRKNENIISMLKNEKQNLAENIKTLNNEKNDLLQKIEEEKILQASVIENYEKEKLTLREINVVVSDQLREKIEELNSLNSSQSGLKDLNEELSQKNSGLSSESLRINIGKEALSHQANELKEEIEELRSQNSSLTEENAALNLVRNAVNQRQFQVEDEGENFSEKRELLAEIERLKQELDVFKADNSDSSYLEAENARLVQRHGEITEEKMQASAKMHTAEKELFETSNKLQTCLKTIEKLEFEHQGLQNLYENLMEQRDALIADNAALSDENKRLEDKSIHISELLQRVSTEKDIIMQDLNKEHLKAASMTEEVNHLRMKSRTLAEDIKGLRDGINKAAADNGLEDDTDQISEGIFVIQDKEIERPSVSSGPNFSGEVDNDEVR